jgi:hypothetical protein
VADFIKVAVAATVKWATSEAAKQTLIKIAITATLSAASAALAKNKAGRGAGGIQQQRELGTAVPRQIAVGRCIVAGSEVALWSSGDGDDNVWNTRVIAVSDWPCALQHVVWQGQRLTWDGDLSTGWRGCQQFIGKKNRQRLFARFYPGSWTQGADSELITHARPGAPWSTDDRLRGVSYFVLRRAYDPDAFPNGPPDNSGFRFEVDNAPVFDWRDPTQSASDVTTWKPSRNPVVLAEFGLCHARAPAQFSPGDTSPLVGPGLDWAQRFAALGDRLTAAANICDEAVDGLPRYEAGGVMEGPAEAWMPKLADACGGEWVQSAAGSWLRPGFMAAPVYAVAPGALAMREASTFRPWQAPDSAVNTVRTQYVEPDNGWQLADLSVTDAALRAADGRELVAQPDLSWVSNRAQANRIIAALLKLEGQRETREVPAPFWTCDLERGDIITLDDPTLPESIWNAWWRVQAVEQQAVTDGAAMALSLRRVPPDAWGPAPPAPPLPPWTPPNLARALQPPPVMATVLALSGAGTSWNEVEFSISDTSVQPLGLVEWVGPAPENTASAFEAANARALPLDRAMGATSTGALVPGWYRWRVAGRTASGGSGEWGGWSAGLQVTAGMRAGAVDWQGVANTRYVITPSEKSRVLIPRIRALRATAAALVAEAVATGADPAGLQAALSDLTVFLDAHDQPVAWDDLTSHTDVQPASGPVTLMGVPVLIGGVPATITEQPIEVVLETVETGIEALRTAMSTGGRQYDNLVNQPPRDDVLAAAAAVVRVDPLYPLSGPSDTRIDVAACEVTFTGRPNESYPAKTGGITGLTHSTSYVVYRDRTAADWIAVLVADVPAYDADPVRYVKVGAQSTQVSGGGSWPALPSPPAPPGGGYDFARLEALE